LTWKQCTDLPRKCWATSIAELDGKVYISTTGTYGGYFPLMYDSYKDKWFELPELPHIKFSLVAVPYKKQLLAIGGMTSDCKVTNKVLAWDKYNKKWATPYPNMPTARCYSSCISHGLAVIVAGGMTCHNPLTTTGVVEVLHIKEHASLFSKSQWSVVERLPHVVCEPVSLIVNDNLYIAVGSGDDGESTCNIVTAFLPDLLQSSIKKARSGKIWNKIPDMPYSSCSINHYQGHLIIFTGDRKVEKSGQAKPSWELIPLIHVYNPDTKSWDHVGDVPCNCLMGISIHLSENKLLFIGGLTGTHIVGKADDMLTTCSMLTFTPK